MSTNLYKEREYLSFSSIYTLTTDPKRRYNEKIKGIRINEFKNYFTRGNAVHAVIEHYNNTGEINKDIAYIKIASDVKLEEERIKDVLPSSVIEEVTAETETAIDNYFSTNPKRCVSAEEVVWAKLIDGLDFWFNGKIDGVGEDYMEDYKVKKSFTNIEKDFKGDYIKYQWQAHFYMAAYEVSTGKRIDKFKMVEILTRVPTLEKGVLKDVIIQMCKDKGAVDPKGTIKDMVQEYDLRSEVVREIWITRDEAMIDRCKKQFNAAYSLYSVAKQMGPDVLLFAMDKPYV